MRVDQMLQYLAELNRTLSETMDADTRKVILNRILRVSENIESALGVRDNPER